LNTPQKLLLTIHGAYGLAATMAGLFLNLYLWRVSQDMTVNAVFMLGTFIMGPISFWLGGALAKRKDRLFSYQLGVGLTAAFYLTVVILQETVASVPFIIGTMNGLSAGFYWLGFLVLLYDIVDTKDRSSFLGKQMAVLGIVTTIGPAFAGFIISMFDSLIGYTLIFALSFILFFTGVLLSFRLPYDSSTKRNLRIALLLRFNRRFTSMRSMWIGWLIWGACEGLIFFLPVILLFQAVDKEYLVGLTTVVLGLTSILASLWHSRYNSNQRQPYTVLVIWIAYVLVSIPLLIKINLGTVMIFLIITEIGKALIGVSYFNYMIRIIGILPRRAGLRTEMIVVREWVVNVGRIISIICFIFLYSISSESIIYLLFIVICTQGVLFPLMAYGKSEISEFEKKYGTSYSNITN
jgi:YQGE family putative transporter